MFPKATQAVGFKLILLAPVEISQVSGLRSHLSSRLAGCPGLSVLHPTLACQGPLSPPDLLEASRNLHSHSPLSLGSNASRQAELEVVK